MGGFPHTRIDTTDSNYFLLLFAYASLCKVGIRSIHLSAITFSNSQNNVALSFIINEKAAFIKEGIKLSYETQTINH